MLQTLTGCDLSNVLAGHDSTTPIVISTAGMFDSTYVMANPAYLGLVERTWPDLCNRNLIGRGAAISNPGRDRRLFLLDTIGRYVDERAVISHRSGRPINVAISAWRFSHAGTAFDLEVFREVKGRPATYPASGAPGPGFLPTIAHGLSVMAPAQRRTVLLRMLTVVAEGAILLGLLLTSHAPAARYALTLRERLQGHVAETLSEGFRVKLDFELYAYEDIESALLEIAGEIWALIRFSRNADASFMMKSLVEPYTSPADSVCEL